VIPLVVIENPRRSALDLPDAEIVAAGDYLLEARYSQIRRATVFNLCRTYGYQTVGYSVSLRAAARGHRPLPSVTTLQDLRLSPLVRIVSQELDRLIQCSLAPLQSTRFELSIYFGRNVAGRYDRLARALFNQFPVPLLRASFVRVAETGWELRGIRAIATSEIPEAHRQFVTDQARRYFARPMQRAPRKPTAMTWRSWLPNKARTSPPTRRRFAGSSARRRASGWSRPVSTVRTMAASPSSMRSSFARRPGSSIPPTASLAAPLRRGWW
jgi:hypothetical protein